MDVLDYAESTRCLEMMNDPGQKDGFEETQRMVRHCKSQRPPTKTVTELKLKLIPCKEMDLSLGS